MYVATSAARFTPDRRSRSKPRSPMSHRRQHLSSFSPSWCIGPPPVRPHLSRSASVSHAHRTTTSSSTSGAAHKEPCSPKISCMGQIKTQKSAHHGKGGGGGFTKLTRILSERTMTVRSSAGARSCARVRDGRGSAGGVSVADMDPPLPVARRDGGGPPPVSLWRRRKGPGMELRLEGLQLQKQEMQRQLCLDDRFEKHAQEQPRQQ